MIKISMQLLSPLIVTITVVWGLRLIYFWQRNASFKRRERRRQENPAERLTIPANARGPELYEGGGYLHDAQTAYLTPAVKAQGSYFANGILAAVLPSLALFLLSIQIVGLGPSGGWVDLGWILSEILCLLILLYLVLTRREPTAEWIENRVRTELFRREQYLLLAGVGPYLLKESSESVQEALRRRGQIEGADTHSLIALIPMQDSSGLTWLEALHHRGAFRLPTHPDLTDRMESYLYHRIGKQLLWFANEIRDLEEMESFWSSLLTGALLAAMAVAAVHAVHLYDGHIKSETLAGMAHSKTIVALLAIVMPPLGAAFLSIRALYNFRGRGQIYNHQKNILRSQRGTLEALLQEMTATSGMKDVRRIDFNFRAIALRTEQSLSIELSQWMLLMERRDHELSP